MAEMSTVNELREHARVLECRAAFIGDDNTGSAQMERDALDAAARLLEREAHSLETIGTHWADCWSAGRDHYQCLRNEVERLRKRNDYLESILADANQRDMVVLRARNEQLRREVERLRAAYDECKWKSAIDACKPWIQHKPDCLLRFPPQVGGSQNCTCGYEDFLRGVKHEGV